MSDLQTLKTKLWEQVDHFVETREESTEAAEQLKETIEAIRPLSPVLEPMNEQPKVGKVIGWACSSILGPHIPEA